MSTWKPFEMLVPVHLSPTETVRRLYEQVRFNATEAGEFVEEIRIERVDGAGEGWQKWRVAYRPGPPAPFPRVPRTLPDTPEGATAGPVPTP